MNPILPEGSVIITPNQMFDELRATHDEVKKLSQGFESLTNNLASQLQEVKQVAADHERRLRSLERKLWTYGGALTVAAAVLSYVTSHLPPW